MKKKCFSCRKHRFLVSSATRAPTVSLGRYGLRRCRKAAAQCASHTPRKVQDLVSHSQVEDSGGADAFLCSLVSCVFSSGMLMETAKLPPHNAMLGWAAGQLRVVSLGGVAQCGLLRPRASHQSPHGSHGVEEAALHGPRAGSAQHSELTPPPAPRWRLGNIEGKKHGGGKKGNEKEKET